MPIPQTSRALPYSKAHACGNDFLIVEEALPHTAGPDSDAERALAIALCARTTGIGADGVEFLRWTGERAGTIRLRNADGSIAEISGNGTRCVAAWMAHRTSAAPGAEFMLHTDAGPRICVLVEREGRRMLLRSRMGVPTTEWIELPLPGSDEILHGAVVHTGNPHLVFRVEQSDFALHGRPWQQLGATFTSHERFPAGTNVEFLHIRSEKEVEIRIFERGVGPTSSSGTGSCAAAAAAIAFHGCHRHLTVRAPGGPQQVAWPAAGGELELTGPAELIASGEAFVDLPQP